MGQLIELFEKLLDKQLQGLYESAALYQQGASEMKNAMNEIEVTKQYEQQIKQLSKDEPGKTEQFKSSVDRDLQQDITSLQNRTKSKLAEQAKFDKENEIVQQREIRAVSQKLREQDRENERDFRKRKELISHKLSEKARLEELMAGFHHEQRLRKFDSFRSDTLAHILAIEKEKQQGETALFKTKMDGFKNFFSGAEGRKRLTTLFGFSAATIGIAYCFRVAAPLSFHYMKQKIFAPKLVSVAVRQHPWTKLLRKKDVEIVIPEDVKSKMEGIIEATKNTADRGGIFGHILLHGAPGTGKTLFGMKLAQDSNMDFLMLSGSAFGQFDPKDAIMEINNLFKWVKQSKRGALIFIDEADSFLEDRDTLTPSRIRVLNEFIYHTGTESRDFRVVFETNRPWVIDPAVMSRISRSIQFPNPSADDIESMLQTTLHSVLNPTPTLLQKITFRSPAKIDYTYLKDPQVLRNLAEKLAKANFVGRDITNFVILLAQAAFACDMKITPALVDEIVEQQIMKKQRELAMQTPTSLLKE